MTDINTTKNNKCIITILLTIHLVRVKKNKCNDTVKMNNDEQHSDKLMTCPGLNSVRHCN